MTRDNSVQVLGNAARVNQCPAGKLALHTNINSNESSGAGGTRDILTTPPNRQLEIKLPESCGFNVGQYEGVSGVVNKLSQPATLVSGMNLNRDRLRINAGKRISSLVNYKRPFGATWNGATNSAPPRISPPYWAAANREL